MVYRLGGYGFGRPKVGRLLLCVLHKQVDVLYVGCCTRVYHMLGCMIQLLCFCMLPAVFSSHICVSWLLGYACVVQLNSALLFLVWWGRADVGVLCPVSPSMFTEWMPALALVCASMLGCWCRIPAGSFGVGACASG